MFSIKKEVLSAFLEASKNTYPHEFLGFLSGDKKNKTVNELVVVPATFGDTFSMVHLHLVPFDPSFVGTCHSHPSYSNKPSREDKKTFAKTGKIHFIASYPYTLNTIAFYDEKGNQLQVKIV